jgi:hypothetical protein
MNSLICLLERTRPAALPFFNHIPDSNSVPFISHPMIGRWGGKWRIEFECGIWAKKGDEIIFEKEVTTETGMGTGYPDNNIFGPWTTTLALTPRSAMMTHSLTYSSDRHLPPIIFLFILPLLIDMR